MFHFNQFDLISPSRLVWDDKLPDTLATAPSDAAPEVHLTPKESNKKDESAAAAEATKDKKEEGKKIKATADEELKAKEVVAPKYTSDRISAAQKDNQEAVDDFMKGELTVDALKKAIGDTGDTEDMEVISWALTAKVSTQEEFALAQSLHEHGFKQPRDEEAVKKLWEDPNAGLNLREYRILQEIVEVSKKLPPAEAVAADSVGAPKKNSPEGQEIQDHPGEVTWLDAIALFMKKLSDMLDQITDKISKAFNPKGTPAVTPTATAAAAAEAAPAKFKKSPIPDQSFDMKTKNPGEGVDLTVDKPGLPVAAVTKGTVEKIEGDTVTIKANEKTKFVYKGVKDITVKVGDTIAEEGHILGKMTTTVLNLKAVDDAGQERSGLDGYLRDYSKQKVTPQKPEGNSAEKFALKNVLPVKPEGNTKVSISKDYNPETGRVEMRAPNGVVQALGEGGTVTDIDAKKGSVTLKYPDRTVVTYSGLKIPFEDSVKKGALFTEGAKIGTVGAKGRLALIIKEPDGKFFDPTEYLKRAGVTEKPKPVPAEATVADSKAQGDAKSEQNANAKPEAKKEEGKLTPLMVNVNGVVRKITDEEIKKVFAAFEVAAPVSDEDLKYARSGFYRGPNGDYLAIPREVIDKAISS